LSSITINGKIVTTGDTVQITGNQVFVDGKLVVDGIATFPVVLNIEGAVNHIIADGSVKIKGHVNGSVDAGGSVYCGNVGSTVTAGGSVTCKHIEGSVDAGGSVTYVSKYAELGNLDV
jgi:hypothetical protein